MMVNLAIDAEQPREWSYMQDEAGIVYCLGRAIDAETHEVTATYYRTDSDLATKQTLDGRARYSRFIYQGLPEERARLITVERPDVVDRLDYLTAETGVGIYLKPKYLDAGDSLHREVSTWVESKNPKAYAFQNALQIACDALLKAEVTIDELSLYGAASFGLVGTTDKTVEDIDIVFSASRINELRELVSQLQTGFRWSDIDPFDRLAESRQKLKAKRWSTSQIRLLEPHPLTIDLKVGRQPGAASLWDLTPEVGDIQPYVGELRVVDDTETYCMSPAVQCEDKNGDEKILLLEGYQYIGTLLTGDVVEVNGDAYADSQIIKVSQARNHGIVPDFRNVPVT